MTTSQPSTPATRLAVDTTNQTITLLRSFDHAPERVFEAWTSPEQVSVWWDPSGEPLAACEIDLRPGGVFKFVNKGQPHAFTGAYIAIEPPNKIVFDAMGSVGTVEIERKTDRTLMTVVIKCSSPEHLQHFLKLGIDTGTSKTLDNLVNYLGGHVA